MKTSNSRILISIATLSVVTGLVYGCGKKTAATATVPPPNLGTAVAAIRTGILTAGKSMGPAALMGSSSLQSEMNDALLTPATCDSHGYPVVSNNSPSYPGHLTYCFTTIDQGDTVIGGFGTATFVSCLVNQLGVQYDGAAHIVTVTDATIAACSLTGTGLTSGTQLTLTGSAPASFNNNYGNGVVIDLSAAMGLTFKIATNVTGSKTSFITNESWTDGSMGTTGGTLDSTTGDVWYESRVERMNCTTPSRCGWDRHTRIHALLTLSGGKPTGLTSLTFAYSNIQTTPGQNAFAGLLITSSGDLTAGIKARMWNATNGSGGAPTGIANYNTVANWVEAANTACYTSASETASTCGTGLAAFSTNTNFLLNTSDTHTAVPAWLAAITGQTFANVNVNSDTQF